MESLDKIITVVSLFLTPSTISVAFFAVIVFSVAFQEAIKENMRTSVNWMVIGVVFGQLSGVFDNTYWFLAWSAHYVNPSSDIKHFFFDHGVYSNTVFRQAFGLIGSFCHIKAGSTMQLNFAKFLLFTSAVFGVFWVLFLEWLKV